MRTLRKELLIAVLTLVVMGLVGSTYAVAARKSKNIYKHPKYLALYVQQGAKIYHLHQGALVFRTALTQGPDKSGLYGIPAPPKIKLDVKPISILVFDPETAGTIMRLAKLKRVEKAPAHDFDFQVTKLEPAAFGKNYHVKYDESIPINLWCVEKDIQLQVDPVAGKPGWYRAVPEQELEAGIYAINFGCVDGPRLYSGDLKFYPFGMGPIAPKPPVCKAKRRVKRRRVARHPVVAAPPAVACLPAPRVQPPPPRRPAPTTMLNAGLSYDVVNTSGRREYQITNLNDIPWHNVNIEVYVRDNQFPATVLGPVEVYKNIVLPDQTVNQAPDKTMLQYERLSDAGDKIYLKIKCKEGVIRKAWQNVSMGDSGPADLVPVPWDLKE